MLAWEHHRLVKYPLLLQQIVKYTAEDSPEMEVVKEVLARTKDILNSIDREVAEAQNKKNLEELQRNLDTSGLEKMGTDNPVFMEYRNVDLTKFRLIYDGQLTLNLGGENRRVKNIELYVLLLEDCVMFLQRQDEKYLLKFHTGSNSIVPGGTKDEVQTTVGLKECFINELFEGEEDPEPGDKVQYNVSETRGHQQESFLLDEYHSDGSSTLRASGLSKWNSSIELTTSLSRRGLATRGAHGSHTSRRPPTPSSRERTGSGRPRTAVTSASCTTSSRGSRTTWTSRTGELPALSGHRASTNSR